MHFVTRHGIRTPSFVTNPIESAVSDEKAENDPEPADNGMRRTRTTSRTQ